MAIRTYRPDDPTNFEGEEARTVAEIRRSWKASPRPRNFGACSWHSRKEQWIAKIEADREKKYLGSYVDEIEAAKAYDEAALKLHDPANTNFPPSDYDVEKGETLP